jgi:Ras-related protein Rab-1A
VDTQQVKLQIWDTAGQERFHTITTSYYHSAHGIAVVYDISDRASFDAVEQWFSEVNKLASPEVCKLLIGNKSDLDSRAVSVQEGEGLARSLGISFIETSAKSCRNVTEMFTAMGAAIYKQVTAGASTGRAGVVSLPTGRSIDADAGGWCYC